MLKVIKQLFICCIIFFCSSCHRAIDQINIDGELASEEYQKLGQEAQNALVPRALQVPIKKLSSTWELYMYYAAIVESNGIYVNEEKLNKFSYGLKRYTFFHEAVHVKYQESFHSELISANKERRADIEGSYATECYLCVQTMMKYRNEKPDSVKQQYILKGYLSPTELQKISDELKQQNKLCDYHINQ